MKYTIFLAKLIIVSLSIYPLSAISMETNEQKETIEILHPQSQVGQSEETIRESIVSKLWEPDPEYKGPIYDCQRINIPLNIFLNNTLRYGTRLDKEQHDFLDTYKNIPLPWELDATAKEIFDSLPYKAFVDIEMTGRVKRRSSLPMKLIKKKP